MLQPAARARLVIKAPLHPSLRRVPSSSRPSFAFSPTTTAKNSKGLGAAYTMSSDKHEQCPVCKSTPYLNPDMRFKINPDCYHKMCESCVDRIFSRGNTLCPIPGCNKTLRLNKFRTQTFEDLRIEREVDIRKRVMRVLNKSEDEFETLRDYNDYLEQVEEATWNLILKIDVDATEARLRRWEDHQKAQLSFNAVRRDGEFAKKGAVARKGPNAAASDNTPAPSTLDDTDCGFAFRGLKKRVAPAKEAPFDPFSGCYIMPQYYVLQDDYEVDWYKSLKKDSAHLTGNWEVSAYASRTLREAFGGFGIFIEDEISAGGLQSMDAEVATERAALEAGQGHDTTMDDVF